MLAGANDNAVAAVLVVVVVVAVLYAADDAAFQQASRLTSALHLLASVQ